MPVQADVFKVGGAGPELTAFTNAIEQIMDIEPVIAAVGEQSIDASGLLKDNVAFTVEYTPTSTTPTSVTAEALVPVGMLNFEDALIGRTLLAEVEAIIDGVYNNLKAAAEG